MKELCPHKKAIDSATSLSIYSCAQNLPSNKSFAINKFMSIKPTKHVLLIFSMATLLLASCTDSMAPVYAGTTVQIINPEKLSELENHFQRYGYTLNEFENGIPPIILQSFPQEITEVGSIKQKKKVFFQSLLPIILLANQEILRERDTLKRLQDRFLASAGKLNETETHQLETLGKRYGVHIQKTPDLNTIKKLLDRIDIIPADLALAQAANESAYGTSRFSQLANNLFGEWTFTPGTGIVPEGRPEGEIYEVRRFSSLLDSVRSYQKNLNTHSAYRTFRALRAAARKQSKQLSGAKLAEGLLNYSTRREAYIADLQAMIRYNRLDRYTSAQLRKS